MKTYKRLIVLLDEAEHKRIKTYAFRNNISQSKLAKRAILQYLAEKK